MNDPDAARAALARVRAAANGRRRAQGVVRAPKLSSAHPDDRDPQMIGNLLDGWVRANEYGADIAVAGLLDRWERIVGEQVARHTRVVEFVAHPEGGRLVVQADSAEWALQLRYLAGNIRRRIDDALGAGIVASLDIRGPGGRSSSGRWRVRTGRRSPRSKPDVAPPPEV